MTLPVVVKSGIADIWKKKHRIWATSYTTDESFKKHESCFGFFIPDDDSLKKGREVIITYRRVNNNQHQDEEGYGYKDIEAATKDRLLFRVHKRWLRFRETLNIPRTRSEFSDELEDKKTVFRELSSLLLDEIGPRLKRAKI